jgi:hypothetical protein
MLVMAVCISTISAAMAQGTGLNPFPKDDVYRVHYVGDWWMNGLDSSLSASLRTIPRIQIQPTTIELQSLRRTSWAQHVEEIEERARATPIDIAIVMFGVSETGSLFRPDAARLRIGDEEWSKAYAARVDKVMKALRATNGAVYWVSMPIVRRRDHSEIYQAINTIVRERAYANGVTYIDIYSRFQDESGGFDRYGPDLDGTIKLMRNRDGIYFTSTGYAKIAHFVLQVIRRDFNRVKTERVVELAGTESEQLAVKRRGQPAPPRPGTTNPARRRTAGTLPGQSRFDGQKADHGSFEYSTIVNNKNVKIKLELPRPPLSGAIIDLVTRNQSKSRPAQLGDNVVQVIAGGVPLLSTVTPADQNELAIRKRNLSPTQSVFFKVWGKGERLDPKPGRADDFVWPRPEPEPVVHVAAKLATPQRPAAPPRDPSLPPLPMQRPDN